MRFQPIVECGVGPVESTGGKTSSVFLLVEYSFFTCVKVLEKLSQKALFFPSCDWNTAISLAEKTEIGRFVGLPVPC